MLREFKLTAITRRTGQYALRHLPLEQQLQRQLKHEWGNQLQELLAEIEEVPFDPGYAVELQERFVIEDFELPGWFLRTTSRTAVNLGPLDLADVGAVEAIRGLSAFVSDSAGDQLVLFQNLTRSRVIRPGGFVFMDGRTYRTPSSPGLALDDKLAAVYWPQAQKLMFSSFRAVNTFLPLSEYYAEASEQDIRGVLDHPSLAAEDADATAVDASQWTRKRFAMIRDSGILDHFAVEDIVQHAEGYEVDIELDEQGRIIFPSDKRAAKRLLQFLNEEVFRGAITEQLYETNSKRVADGGGA